MHTAPELVARIRFRSEANLTLDDTATYSPLCFFVVKGGLKYRLKITPSFDCEIVAFYIDLYISERLSHCLFPASGQRIFEVDSCGECTVRTGCLYFPSGDVFWKPYWRSVLAVVQRERYNHHQYNQRFTEDFVSHVTSTVDVFLASASYSLGIGQWQQGHYNSYLTWSWRNGLNERTRSFRRQGLH